MYKNCDTLTAVVFFFIIIVGKEELIKNTAAVF